MFACVNEEKHVLTFSPRWVLLPRERFPPVVVLQGAGGSTTVHLRPIYFGFFCAKKIMGVVVYSAFIRQMYCNWVWLKGPFKIACVCLCV